MSPVTRVTRRLGFYRLVPGFIIFALFCYGTGGAFWMSRGQYEYLSAHRFLYQLLLTGILIAGIVSLWFYSRIPAPRSFFNPPSWISILVLGGLYFLTPVRNPCFAARRPRHGPVGFWFL